MMTQWESIMKKVAGDDWDKVSVELARRQEGGEEIAVDAAAVLYQAVWDKHEQEFVDAAVEAGQLIAEGGQFEEVFGGEGTETEARETVDTRAVEMWSHRSVQLYYSVFGADDIAMAISFFRQLEGQRDNIPDAPNASELGMWLEGLISLCVDYINQVVQSE